MKKKTLFRKITDIFTTWFSELKATAKLRKQYRQLKAGAAGSHEDFLLRGAWMDCSRSSNVDLAQYDWEANVLYIEFKGGAVYAYDNVSFNEAVSFANAPSYGKWVWDHLRIRGTKLGHRKPYSLVAFHGGAGNGEVPESEEETT